MLKLQPDWNISDSSELKLSFNSCLVPSYELFYEQF